MGCGTTCDCPRMKENLQAYDWVITQSSLWENGKISLSDIDAKSFALINYYSTEREIVKAEREQAAKEVARLLGAKV
jgi:hypothetical protein